MVRKLIVLIFVSLAPASVFAALPATTVWELNASATPSNVNGGGFDSASSGLPTDLACTVGNTSTPDCQSTTDGTWPAAVVNNWIFISGASGANWNINGKNDGGTTGGGCWWPITGHSTTHITINAAIGAGVCILSGTAVDQPSTWAVNTVAGVGVASPGTGTFGIDYSQNTAAVVASNTTFGSTTGAPTTLTSTAAFDPTMVHNLLHITATGTGAHCAVAWYEITAYTDTSDVTTDRATNNGTNCVTGTGSIGGAISLGTATDGAPLTASVAGNIWWMHSGTYSPSANFNAGVNGTALLPIAVAGYNAARSDLGSTGTSRPVMSLGANAAQFGANDWLLQNISFTGTGATVLNNSGGVGILVNLKVVNSSTTIAQVAAAVGNTSFVTGMEAVSYRGIALSIPSTSTVIGCYLHDSDIGLRLTGTYSSFYGCIVSNNVTDAVNVTTASTDAQFMGNTFYGSENKIGTVMNVITASGNFRLMNNIFYGFVSGIVWADVQSGGYDEYNDYYNITTLATNWQLGKSDLSVNPTFASMAQTTGTGATSSTNVLTDSAAHFNSASPAIVNNQDFVYLSAGTGTGIGLYKYLITTHDDTTLTLSSNITSSGSGSAISYSFTTGENYAIGTNLKAHAYPGLFPGGLTSGYLDIGAVQRQEPPSSSSHKSILSLP